MDTKKPLLISVAILLIVAVLGIALAVSRPKPAAVQTQKPRATVSPALSPAAEKKYKVASSVKDYEIKVVQNTLEEYLTKMGVFKENGLYDPVSKKQVTAESVLIVLSDREQTMDESIFNKEKLGKTGAFLDAKNKIMVYYVYLYPEQYKKTADQLSLSFSRTLRDIITLTTALNGKVVKQAPQEVRELLWKMDGEKIVSNAFSLIKTTVKK